MNHHCDGCGKQIKEVGKLFKIGYMMLCKQCRTNHRMGRMGLSVQNKAKPRKVRTKGR